MAKTKGSRNLVAEEREKIAKELKKGATYPELMKKYGMKSNTAFRKICKDFQIEYSNSAKKMEQLKLDMSIMERKFELDENGIIIAKLYGQEFYLTKNDVMDILAVLIR